MIEPKRLNETAARGSTCGKELLEMAQRNPRFVGDLARSDRWVGKAMFHYRADAGERLLLIRRTGQQIAGGHQRTNEITDGELHVEFGRSTGRIAPLRVSDKTRQQTDRKIVA